MNIEKIAEYINVKDIPQDWIIYHEEAYKSFNPNWLDINFNEIFSFYDLDEQTKNDVLETVKTLKNDTVLNYLVYLWYYIIFLTDKKGKIYKWNTEFDYFKTHGSFMMPVVAMLMGIDIHKKVMTDKNYSEEQILLQKKNIRETCLRDNERFQIKGIRFSQMIWGSRFMKGNIIEAGSLQFEVKKNFYNNEDVIFIHIPRNTSLKAIDVEKTFRKAKDLVPKYLTLRKLKWVTESWLLSPNLKDILDTNSNIRQFQNLFFIEEYKENTKDFLNFVFNEPLNQGEYSDLAENTTIQREIKKKLLNKEPLYIGIGILDEKIFNKVN